jgi:protein PhnA
MTTLPPCPICQSALSYEDGAMLVCPECGHEWAKDALANMSDSATEVRDAHGNTLEDRDHNIDCRIEGIGEMKLKSEFVKKA